METEEYHREDRPAYDESGQRTYASSVAGCIERLTFDMSAAMEDLRNYEDEVLDSKATYDSLYEIIKYWRDDLRTQVIRMFEAKRQDTVIETIYNPINPRFGKRM